MVVKLGDDLGQCGAEVVSFGRGERGGGVLLERGAGRADWVADGAAAGSEVQADQAGIFGVGPAGQQAGLFHPGRGIDDGRRGDLKPAGDLARGQPVLFPQHAEHDVLADPDTVTAHRLVGVFPEQLGCLGEQSEQVGHCHSIFPSTLTTC